MKFNSLVVAAMVIASVNAGGRDKGAGGHKHNDGSEPRSGAPFGLKVHPLFLAMSAKSLESGPDTSQNLDHTNNKGSHDLTKHEVYEDQNCKIISLILHDLQKSIFILFGKYLKSKATISRLQIKTDSPEPRKENRYLTPQSITSATMEEIKEKAIILRGEYVDFWGYFLDEKCSNKLNRLSSPEKIGRLKFFIGVPIKPSDFDKTQETAV
ncbi:hypothetical protein BASA50_007159 [Batrachochytrium salamandrivorans]|uniref:Uncharacterized protein n=1 Tax=Batrachochytrium salamandrivorans TaxID=1357716 RepID=A0ABQ8F7T6_9FUNG|nr:hypothetical protein BASA62_009706 [Batrachochytrium salamandrivorans]KAH6589466.1 hypothetical protein BASA61_005597 [Batrachochytrium salamandrivorans]KAH6593723.1 hypothetical protein BASA50_007159 [Batrachochytrium salamandrivorans]KAH9265189.1 hypothetical protein BASA83_011272 [Batrachochytrium salamandrivorans]